MFDANSVFILGKVLQKNKVKPICSGITIRLEETNISNWLSR
jgi:hypothetical protein